MSPNFENIPDEPIKNGNGKPKFPPSVDILKVAQQHEKALAKALEKSAAPPRIIEPRCHVCTSDYRDYIEGCLNLGHSYLSIQNSLPEDVRVDRRSISSHQAKGHMPIRETAFRAILEQEASLESQNFETGVRGAVTLRGMLEILARKGFEDVVNDLSQVEVKDLVQIVKLKAEMDENTAIIQIEEYRRQVEIITKAIQEVIPQNLITELMVKIDKISNELKEQSDVGALVRGTVVDSTADEI